MADNNPQTEIPEHVKKFFSERKNDINELNTHLEEIRKSEDLGNMPSPKVPDSIRQLGKHDIPRA